jgi:hypothetical protein
LTFELSVADRKPLHETRQIAKEHMKRDPSEDPAQQGRKVGWNAQQMLHSPSDLPVRSFDHG